MRKNKLDEQSDKDYLIRVINGKKEALISEALWKQKLESEKNLYTFIIASIILIYIFYMFYSWELSLRKIQYSSIEFNLINTIKYTFLFFIILRVIKSLITLNEQIFREQLLVKDFQILNNELYLITWDYYNSWDEVSKKIPSSLREELIILVVALMYLFLFVTSIIFLDYLWELWFLWTTIKFFELLNYPIIPSMIFTILVYSFISGAKQGSYSIRPILNTLEVITVIILLMWIFQWL